MTSLILSSHHHLAPLSATYARRDEQLWIEVDGVGPEDLIRGELTSGPRRATWCSVVRPTGYGTWEGAVVRETGDASLLPHTHVEVGLVRRSLLTGGRGSATATFSGGGVPTVTRTYAWLTAG